MIGPKIRLKSTETIMVQPKENTPLLGGKNQDYKPHIRKIRTLLASLILLSAICIISLFTKKQDNAFPKFSIFKPLPQQPLLSEPKSSHHSFSIKHIYHHNTRLVDRNVHKRLDITPSFIKANDLLEDFESLSTSQEYNNISPWTVSLPFKSEEKPLMRLVDRDPELIDSYLNYARLHGSEEMEKFSLDWHEEPVIQPNVTDRDTIISLALMSSNAYVEVPETDDWRDVGWNKTYGHGWNETGLRGYIFVSDDEKQVVIAYKGTSGAYVSGGSDATVEEDRDNDNLLFSCCCARVSYIWTPVCDCYTGTQTCDQKCLEREIYRKDRYFSAASNIYRNVTNLYPNANIWITGHSLGGSLSALLGRAYGVPAVSFEAPGEALAAKRLHLPFPPGLPEYAEGIWHFGHTADPIFMGTCNGSGSACSIAGYAMETQCHSGKQCVYDPVTDYGWHVNILNHRIHTVVDEVIMKYNDTAKCIKSPPCKDCYNWKFVLDRDGDKKPPKPPPKTETLTTTISLVDPEPTGDGKCKKWNWYGKCVQY